MSEEKLRDQGLDKNSAEENPWRAEIVSTIFGDVGNIKADYSCAIQRQILLQGRMYVTERFICFYSNLFGFEKKIKIPFTHINAVTKATTAGVIHNALTVLTAKGEYTFRSFWDREQSLQMIKECHEVACQLRGMTPHLSSSSTALPAGDSAAAATAPVVVTELSPSPPQAEAAPTTNEAASPLGPPARTSALTDDDEELDYGGVGEEGPGGGALDGGVDGFEDRPVVDPAEAFAEVVARRTFKYQGVRKLFPNMSLAEFVAAFIATEEGGDKGKGKAVALGAAVNADAAEEGGEGGGCCGSPSGGGGLGAPLVLGIAEWHERKGDTEVRTEDWKEVASSEPKPSATASAAPAAAAAAAGSSSSSSSSIRSHVRTFRFRTPLSAPIGPSSTRATKTQRFRRFGDGAGCIVDTVTVLEDIPYGDCFEVEDRWIVKPTPPPSSAKGGSEDEAGEGGGVELCISFEIKWMKGTMWKGAIETKTKMDMLAFFVKCADTMEQLFREHKHKEKVELLSGASQQGGVTAALPACLPPSSETTADTAAVAPAATCTVDPSSDGSSSSSRSSPRPAGRSPSSAATLAAATPPPPWISAVPWVLLGFLLLLQVRAEWRSSARDAVVLGELASLQDAIAALQKAILKAHVDDSVKQGSLACLEV